MFFSSCSAKGLNVAVLQELIRYDSSRVPGCQIFTNDGLTRSGTGCFIAVHICNSERQRVNCCLAQDVEYIGRRWWWNWL